jgi:pyridoxamine 5'-phosphate oxidase
VDPIGRFQELLAEAARTETADPTAMALATADSAGQPSVRIVLLKAADARGFVFYTNLRSRKGRELAENPRAALCFHWPAIGWQVRASGTVELVTDEEADTYFASRPRGSQIGAWASRQSEPLADRSELTARFHAVEERFGDGAVPRPRFWSGYRLLPVEIEIWRSDEFRLHHRTRYRRLSDGGWDATLLQP